MREHLSEGHIGSDVIPITVCQCKKFYAYFRLALI
jgi:uncharacterized CHY-type Zn-finger protein